MADVLRSRIDQATLAAEEFSNLYHEAFDRRRQAVTKLYKDDASLVWNGNASNGVSQISTFLDSLPTSEHVIEAMDTQPLVAGEGMNDESKASILVTFSGKVKFQGSEFKPFTQTIILTIWQEKWKIASETFRFAE